MCREMDIPHYDTMHKRPESQSLLPSSSDNPLQKGRGSNATNRRIHEAIKELGSRFYIHSIRRALLKTNRRLEAMQKIKDGCSSILEKEKTSAREGNMRNDISDVKWMEQGRESDDEDEKDDDDEEDMERDCQEEDDGDYKVAF
ncbi:hypothetical protein Gohar_009133 [Gossypium harknessii]|uniref:Uncharacterized protein n=1 Tax=Gossypium harknessii TaxID=34285 RepID=A0A7J9GLX7_9ROSI|nr:hypothetical protein [Gossypium harknessii]